MEKTDLTNQRQVFVVEYVRSGDHLVAAKKAGYKYMLSCVISLPILSRKIQECRAFIERPFR